MTTDDEKTKPEEQKKPPKVEPGYFPLSLATLRHPRYHELTDPERSVISALNASAWPFENDENYPMLYGCATVRPSVRPLRAYGLEKYFGIERRRADRALKGLIKKKWIKDVVKRIGKRRGKPIKRNYYQIVNYKEHATNKMYVMDGENPVTWEIEPHGGYSDSKKRTRGPHFAAKTGQGVPIESKNGTGGPTREAKRGQGVPNDDEAEVPSDPGTTGLNAPPPKSAETLPLEKDFRKNGETPDVPSGHDQTAENSSSTADDHDAPVEQRTERQHVRALLIDKKVPVKVIDILLDKTNLSELQTAIEERDGDSQIRLTKYLLERFTPGESE